MKPLCNIITLLCALATPLAASDVVILLHGLARTSASFEKMENGGNERIPKPCSRCVS